MIAGIHRPVLGLLVGLMIGAAAATPALASPTDTAAALRANAADLYARAAANAADMRSSAGNDLYARAAANAAELRANAGP